MKHQLVLRILTIAFLSSFATSVYGAGYKQSGQSAGALGAGSVGAANRDEANLTYYNPAMMAVQESSLSLGAGVVVSSAAYEGPSGERADSLNAVTPLPQFHGHYRMGEFALGVGFSTPYGYGIDWGDDWLGAENGTGHTEVGHNINANAAWLVHPKLSIAIGVQAMRTITTVDRSLGVPAHAELEASGWGFGPSASIAFLANDSVTLGLTYRSRIAVEAEGDAEFKELAGTPMEGELVNQEITTSRHYPHSLMAGLGYAFDNFWLGVDAEWANWSVNDSIRVLFSEPCPIGATTCDPVLDGTNPASQTVGEAWEDVFSLRIGAQYQITPNLPIRFGFAVDMTPIPDQTGPLLPEGPETSFSLGIGYEAGDWRGDLGYEISGSSREITDGSLDGQYKMFSHVMGLTLGYRL